MHFTCFYLVLFRTFVHNIFTMEKRKVNALEYDNEIQNNRIEKERKFWDTFAKHYDKNNQNNAENVYCKLYKMFFEDIRGTKNLLEAGTGTGLIALRLSKLVPSITALDLSPEMLKIAQKKANIKSIQNIDFIEGDICNLKFTDHSYDIVIASNVLHLLFDPERAISELKRVLKADGKIIIPTYCHGENLLSRTISRMTGLAGFKVRTRWSVKSFQNFVKSTGFEVLKNEKIKGSIPLCYLVASPIKAHE